MSPASSSLQAWGPWRFDAERRLLLIGTEGEPDYYEVALDEADRTDWVEQIRRKNWASLAVVGGLMRALDDLGAERRR